MIFILQLTSNNLVGWGNLSEYIYFKSLCLTFNYKFKRSWMIHSLIWTMYENLKILPPPHKFCIIRHNPLIPTVFCRPPLNTGSWPWTWRRWLLSGRFSGSRRSKRSQRSEFKPLPHLFFWNSIFLPRFVNEFLFHMPRDIFRKTAWHILIYTILNTL